LRVLQCSHHMWAGGEFFVMFGLRLSWAGVYCFLLAPLPPSPVGGLGLASAGLVLGSAGFGLQKFGATATISSGGLLSSGKKRLIIVSVLGTDSLTVLRCFW